MDIHVFGVFVVGILNLRLPQPHDEQKLILFDSKFSTNTSVVKPDLPLEYCSIIHKATALSVQCDELNQYYDDIVIASGGALENKYVNTESFRYCSYVLYYKDNQTAVASSIFCEDFEKFVTINLQVDKCRPIDIKWQCSLCDGNTTEAAILLEKFKSDYNHEPEGTSKLNRQYFYDTRYNYKWVYAFSVIVCLIALLTCVLNKDYSPVSQIQEWVRIQDDCKHKLEEIFRAQRERREFHRKRREEMERENGRSIQQNFVALFNSITQTLTEETRNFNDWIETPD